MLNAIKIWWATRRAVAAIRAIADDVTREEHKVAYYGANDIHPRNLALWICVKTDAERDRLQAQPALMERLRQALRDAGYPEEGVNGVHIGFESQETVDREAGGDWFQHWK